VAVAAVAALAALAADPAKKLTDPLIEGSPDSWKPGQESDLSIK